MAAILYVRTAGSPYPRFRPSNFTFFVCKLGAAGLHEIAKLLQRPSCNRINPIDDDWNGDPAIFFWITLSDEAADPAILPQTSRRIRERITQQLDPADNWDLIPHVNFRSQSEQEKLKEQVYG